MSEPAGVIQPCHVKVRHITQNANAQGVAFPGGLYFMPQPPEGVNGENGWVNAELSPSLGENGTMTITFPNGVGDDGVLHRRRFLICARRNNPALRYRAGDEWLEVRRSPTPGLGLDGELLGVVTPTTVTGLSRAQLNITCADAMWLLRRQRESAAGAWTGAAPRDVFEHYTCCWRPGTTDDFTDQVLAFSTSQQTTFRWSYQRTVSVPGAARFQRSTGLAYLQGATRLGTRNEWRIEATFQIAAITPAITLDDIKIGGVEDAGTPYAHIRFVLGNGLMYALAVVFDGTSQYSQKVPIPGYDPTTPVKAGWRASASVERRGRWTWFHINGQAVCVLPSPASSGQWTTRISSSAQTADIDILNVNSRGRHPYLQTGAARGDARLPGQLTPGGLKGEFFDDADLAAADQALLPVILAQLNPTRVPVASRLEPTMNLPSTYPTAPDTWMPPGCPPTNFSARFTGAIYLDLAYDYALRATCDDRCRVWVGDTRWGSHLISDWTSGHAMTATTGAWLKSGSSAASAPAGSTGILAGETAGWFPIVVEYANGTGNAGLILELQRSDTLGTWAALTPDILSPQGCHAGASSGDSHYEQLIHLRDTYGLQFTTEPMSLESGEFPGRLIPKVRVGRDSDKVLTADEGTNLRTVIDAQEVCDILTLDAQGLSDPGGAGQTTREAIDYTGAQPGQHLMLHMEHDSLADITIPEVAEQRAQAMLLLRALPWEEVAATPLGYREQTDTFPVTGSAATLAWKPGDGVRLDLPDLDILDQSCRQIISPSWPMVPDGLGRPQVRFRQRPRGFGQLLRGIIRSQAVQQRTYQGQLTSLPGSLASITNTSGVDAYTRIALPPNLQAIDRVDLVILYKSGTAACTVEINGAATPLLAAAAGTVDVTAYASRAAGANPRMYARLTGAGAEAVEYQLVARIVI